MGYDNPLMKLKAVQELAALPPEDLLLAHKIFGPILRDLRAQAHAEAERSWRSRKSPMAVYHRALSTYARHTAILLRKLAEQARHSIARATDGPSGMAAGRPRTAVRRVRVACRRRSASGHAPRLRRLAKRATP